MLLRRALSVSGLLALTAVLWGCETLVDANPAGASPVLVVGSAFTPGEPWKVTLLRTVVLGDTSSIFAPVSDAVVEVTPAGGVPLTLAYAGGGRYVAADSAGPEVGVTYTLRATAPGLPAVTATDRVPDPVAGLYLDVLGGGGAVAPTLRFLFDDPAGRRDYYEFLVLSGIDLPYGPSAVPFSSSNASLRQESFITIIQSGAGPPTYDTGLISDDLFDGGRFSADLTVVQPPYEGLGVELLVLSETYYRFRRRAAQIAESEENPFAEPIPPYSNVAGGVGLFAGYLRQRTSVVSRLPF